MAEKRTDQNADQLRGGTGGEGTVPPAQDAGPGTHNAAPPRAGNPGSRGTRTDSRDDPESAFEGSRHRSQADIKQRARDEADADTQPRTPHGASEPRHHQIHPAEDDG